MEQNTETTAQSNSDAFSLEDKVLDLASEDGDAGAPDTPETIEQTQPEDVPSFSLSEQMALKLNDKLNAEHLKEIEKGYLRQSDYTKKTQELAQIRQEAEQMSANLNAVMSGQSNGREFVPDQVILSWFQPQELLNIGLAGAGVPVQLWNEFLGYMQEQGAGRTENFRADPYAQQFSQLQQELKQLKSFQQNYTQKQQKDAYEKEMTRIDGEASAVLAKFPDVTKQELLFALAGDGTGKTIEQIAKELADAKEARFQQYIKQKQDLHKKAVKQPTGSRVPIMPKAPKSFDEASELIGRALDEGHL